MKIIPQNNYVLCKRIFVDDILQNEKSQKIFFEKKELSLYEIIDISVSLQNKNMFLLHDIVVCSSTGTELLVDKNTLFLFKIDDIIGKII